METEELLSPQVTESVHGKEKLYSGLFSSEFDRGKESSVFTLVVVGFDIDKESYVPSFFEDPNPNLKREKGCSFVPIIKSGDAEIFREVEKDVSGSAMRISNFSIFLNAEKSNVSSHINPFSKDTSGDSEVQISAAIQECEGEDVAEVSSFRARKWTRLARMKFKGMCDEPKLEGLGKRNFGDNREDSHVKK
ncbi:hypothetical protein ACOSQ3_007400 [Xanthoceras sorbifolium]